MPCSSEYVYEKTLTELETQINSGTLSDSDLKKTRTRYNKLKDGRRSFDEYNKLIANLNTLQKCFQDSIKQVDASNKACLQQEKALEQARKQYEKECQENSMVADDEAHINDSLKKFTSEKKKMISQLRKEQNELRDLVEEKTKNMQTGGLDIKNTITELTVKRLQVQEEVDTISKYVHTERIYYQPEMLGLIIGKKGSTISNIKEKSGTEITLVKDINQVVIKGAPEGVEKAKEMIEKVLKKTSNETVSVRFKMDMYLPLMKLSKKWKKDTGADIYVDKLEGSCKISGTTEQIKSAKKIISDFLSVGLEEKSIQIQKLGNNVDDMVELLYGNDGEMLKKIQKMEGVVRATIDKKNQCFRVSGINSGIEGLRKFVLDLMKEASSADIKLEGTLFDLVQPSLQKIQGETNTLITSFKKNNNVKVLGYNQADVSKAKGSIDAIVEKEKDRQRKTQFKKVIQVDNKVAKSFSKRRDKLQKETDTIIKVNISKSSSVTVFAESEDKAQPIITMVEQEQEKREQEIQQEKAEKQTVEASTSDVPVTQSEEAIPSETKVDDEKDEAIVPEESNIEAATEQPTVVEVEPVVEQVPEESKIEKVVEEIKEAVTEEATEQPAVVAEAVEEVKEEAKIEEVVEEIKETVTEEATEQPAPIEAVEDVKEESKTELVENQDTEVAEEEAVSEIKEVEEIQTEEVPVTTESTTTEVSSNEETTTP